MPLDWKFAVLFPLLLFPMMHAILHQEGRHGERCFI
jgi:hypothetical protein